MSTLSSALFSSPKEATTRRKGINSKTTRGLLTTTMLPATPVTRSVNSTMCATTAYTTSWPTTVGTKVTEAVLVKPKPPGI